ncbi:hypothetical protein AB2N04_12340 [Nitratireductor sp. GISD-1A_MAKvit]|uniref:hypothetical protein n=1 Tax=Nitratireductor sp. GISD-1A_MAKvit TaxID=3234198 RepID=UPI00346550DD
MSDRHLHSVREHLRKLVSRDPIALELYLRDMRHAYIKTAARKLLRLPRRIVRRRRPAQGGAASPQSPADARIPLPSAAKALIANLMAMR